MDSPKLAEVIPASSRFVTCHSSRQCEIVFLYGNRVERDSDHFPDEVTAGLDFDGSIE